MIEPADVGSDASRLIAGLEAIEPLGDHGGTYALLVSTPYSRARTDASAMTAVSGPHGPPALLQCRCPLGGYIRGGQSTSHHRVHPRWAAPRLNRSHRDPNVYRLRQEGVNYLNSHAVFPTVTRVNAAALATGAYPGTNGLVSNSMYVPAVNPNQAFSTGDAANLLKLDAVSHIKPLWPLPVGRSGGVC